MSFIKIEHLNYSYKDENDNPIPVLHDISLEIEKGEYVVILGHNGSGKSTLAKLLNMVIDDYDFLTGKITIDGVEITKNDITEDEVYDLRKKVGMVFQNPDNQLVATIVEEDVAFGPENLGLKREEIRKRVDDALKTVNMTNYAHHEPHRLSGGQKQRVAIAGIIAMMPECMIFDESTAMLDPVGRHEVIETMEKLNKENGICVLSITHYMDEAAMADRVIVLSDGEIMFDGKPSEVFLHERELKSVGLDLPQCASLCRRLEKHGYSFSGDVNTPMGAADAIAMLINEKKQEK